MPRLISYDVVIRDEDNVTVRVDAANAVHAIELAASQAFIPGEAEWVKAYILSVAPSDPTLFWREV